MIFSDFDPFWKQFAHKHHTISNESFKNKRTSFGISFKKVDKLHYFESSKYITHLKIKKKIPFDENWWIFIWFGFMRWSFYFQLNKCCKNELIVLMNKQLGEPKGKCINYIWKFQTHNDEITMNNIFVFLFFRGGLWYLC